MNRIAALMVGVALVAAPSVASAKWTRLSSEHFVFIGDASERQIRSIAERLELFREVVSREVSDQATDLPIRTVVVVFKDARSFGPFRPMFQGRPVELAGYFTGSADASYIAVNATQDTSAYGIIFHEYAHALIRNAIGDLPPWASEGLATFYQTFEAGRGKTVLLGMPSTESLRVLSEEGRLLSIPQLITVDRHSPMYNEGNRRGLFYAQSWALVHYLMFGSPARSGQFQKFLSAVREGVDGSDAFTLAFGSDTGTLEADLRSYMGRLRMTALQVDFDDRIEAAPLSSAETIADEDAAGYLGEMMAYTDREDAARAYLQKAIDSGGHSGARAAAALGRIEMQARHDEQALALFERAVSLAPDMPEAHLGYGRMLLRKAEGEWEPDALIARARAALTRAFELDPHNAAIRVALSQAEVSTADGAERAVGLMQPLVAAAPGREEYRLALAQALIGHGDYPSASTLLGPLVDRSRDPEIQEAAREMIGRLEKKANAASKPLESSSQAQAARPNSPIPEPPADTVSQDASLPVLRPVSAGETRVLGTFSAADCNAGAVVLHVDTAEGVVRLAAARFDDVDFLSYREDALGEVSCGAQRPAYRVFATFRTDGPPIAGAATTNRAVAIELLPDDYAQK